MRVLMDARCLVIVRNVGGVSVTAIAARLTPHLRRLNDPFRGRPMRTPETPQKSPGAAADRDHTNQYHYTKKGPGGAVVGLGLGLKLYIRSLLRRLSFQRRSIMPGLPSGHYNCLS